VTAAAAIAGLIEWVREPGPWRPLKLRFVVDPQRLPGAAIARVSAQKTGDPLAARDALVAELPAPQAAADGCRRRVL